MRNALSTTLREPWSSPQRVSLPLSETHAVACSQIPPGFRAGCVALVHPVRDVPLSVGALEVGHVSQSSKQGVGYLRGVDDQMIGVKANLGPLIARDHPRGVFAVE